MGNRRRRLGPSDTHPQQAAVKSFGKLACKDHADQRLDAFKALSPRTVPSPATRGASGPASLSSAVGGVKYTSPSNYVSKLESLANMIHVIQL